MQVLKVLYYNYYLFYKNILKDSEPYFTANFALGASCSFPLNFIIAIIVIYNHYSLPAWVYFSIAMLLVGLGYIYTIKKGKGEEIVKSKPVLFNSQKLSAAFTIAFFVLTASFLFWGGIYLKHLSTTLQGSI